MHTLTTVAAGYDLPGVTIFLDHAFTWALGYLILSGVAVLGLASIVTAYCDPISWKSVMAAFLALGS